MTAKTTDILTCIKICNNTAAGGSSTSKIEPKALWCQTAFSCHLIAKADSPCKVTKWLTAKLYETLRIKSYRLTPRFPSLPFTWYVCAACFVFGELSDLHLRSHVVRNWCSNLRSSFCIIQNSIACSCCRFIDILLRRIPKRETGARKC